MISGFILNDFIACFFPKKPWLVCLPTCLLNYFEGPTVDTTAPQSDWTTLPLLRCESHRHGDSQKKKAKQFESFLFKWCISLAAGVLDSFNPICNC